LLREAHQAGIPSGDQGSIASTGRGALEEKFALAFVARERGGAFEFGACLLETTEFPEEIASHAR
jgi:hypothetical protein